MPVSPQEPDTTASWVHSPKTSPSVSRKTPSSSHSETDSISSTATTPGAGASSALPAGTVPLDVLAVATSLVTSPGPEAKTTLSTQTESLRESDTTVPSVTHPAEPSTLFPESPSSVSHRQSDSAPSVATSPGAEASSTLPATGPGAGASSALPTVTVPPEVLTMATSLVTSSATEASTTFSTGTVSTDDSDPSISSVTRPAESSSTVPGAATSVSRSDSDSTAPTAPSHGTEASSAGPDVPLSSPEVPGHHSPMGEPPCSTDCFSRANCDWFR
nr:mucin-16-like [Desmodus rotundus]